MIKYDWEKLFINSNFLYFIIFGFKCQQLQELADFEEMPSGPKLSVDDLIRDAGHSDDKKHETPLFFCFIARDQSTG